MKQKILISHPVSDANLARAREQFPQFVWQQTTRERETEDIRDANIVFGKPTDASVAAAAKLEWVQGTSAGMEGMINSETFKRGKFILTTAAGMHESCAEHAFALLLGFSRRVGQHSRLQERQRWNSRDHVDTPWVMKGRTLGILGLGAIGRRIGEIARVIGMRTIGLNYSGRSVPELDEVYPIRELDRLLPRMDAVIMILPATPETDKLMNAGRLAKLPSHCILVNVGRGNAIDEPALIDVLKQNRIAGAALDVFAKEPLPADSPFYDLPNVVMTPHIGGNRPDYDDCAFEILLDNLKRYISGQPLRNVVDRKRGY